MSVPQSPVTPQAASFSLEATNGMYFNGPVGTTIGVIEQKGSIVRDVTVSQHNLPLFEFNFGDILVGFKSQNFYDMMSDSGYSTGPCDVHWFLRLKDGTVDHSQFGVDKIPTFTATDLAVYAYDQGQACIYFGLHGKVVAYFQCHQINKGDLYAYKGSEFLFETPGYDGYFDDEPIDEHQELVDETTEAHNAHLSVLNFLTGLTGDEMATFNFRTRGLIRRLRESVAVRTHALEHELRTLTSSADDHDDHGDHDDHDDHDDNHDEDYPYEDFDDAAHDYLLEQSYPNYADDADDDDDEGVDLTVSPVAGMTLQEYNEEWDDLFL
jgi:hypothetical protein